MSPMPTTASDLIDFSITTTHAVLGCKPDLHLHRESLEHTLACALRSAALRGRRDANSVAETRERLLRRDPKELAQRILDFAGQFDSRGEIHEANVLRDAADLLDQLPTPIRTDRQGASHGHEQS